MRKRPLLVFGFVWLFGVLVAWAIRPGEELVLPGFTEQRLESRVFRDPRRGWRKETTYALDGPWKATVAGVGAGLETRGFRWTKPPIPVWRRDGERESVDLWGTPIAGAPKGTYRATELSHIRAATAGDLLQSWVSEHLPKSIGGSR